MTDRTLLSEICRNCRVSYEHLARLVNLSPNAVKNRVHKLVDDRIVHQFNIVLAADVIDAEFFQATIITDGTEEITTYVEQLGEDPRVGHISILASVRGGAYLVWGQYIGLDDLQDLGRTLRSSEHVVEVELYTLINYRSDSKKMEFSKLHLKVIRCLIRDPRMAIGDIAECAGYSPKSVRRGLRELQESQKVWFTARPDLAAGGLVNIHVRIEWDERVNSMKKIGQWLKERYPISLWDGWATAHNPVLYAEFVVEDLQEAKSTVLDIRESLDIISTSTLVSYSSAKFPFLAEIKLQELVESLQ